MDTWLDLGGVTLRSPVTAFTNLVLSVQCTLYWWRLRAGQDDRVGSWALFFFGMGVATLAGVPKHGLAHVLSGNAYAVVLWTSSLGTAASVYFAQRATLAGRPPARWDRALWLCRFQASLFVVASVAMGPEMWIVVANTVAGLVPVIVAESRSLRHGSRSAGWIVAGLSLSLFTGVVYVGRLSPGIWFNHTDLAHVLMAVSFWLLVRGARPADARQSGRPAVQCRSGRKDGRLGGLAKGA